MKRIKFLLIFLLFINVSYSQELLLEGKKFQNLQVLDINDNKFEIKSNINSNKKIILITWAYWNQHSVRLLNNLQKEYSKWQKETGVKIIALNFDDSRTISKAKEFITKYGWTFDFFFDANLKELQIKYNTKFSTTPDIIVVNEKGIIISHRKGNTDIKIIYEDLSKNQNNEIAKTSLNLDNSKPIDNFPFIENFQNNNNNWPLGENDNLRLSFQKTYNSNYYIIENKTKKPIFITLPFSLNYNKDFEISCKLKQLTLNNNYFGLIFFMKDSINYYDFIINNQSRISITNLNNSSVHILKHPNEAIKKLEYKTLSIRKINNNIYFYVDGIFKKMINYQFIYGDRIGFVLYNENTIGIENLTVKYTQPKLIKITNSTSHKLEVAIAYVYSIDGVQTSYRSIGWYQVGIGETLAPKIEEVEKISDLYLYAMSRKKETRHSDDAGGILYSSVWRVDADRSFNYSIQPIKTPDKWFSGKYWNNYRLFREISFDFNIKDEILENKLK